MKELLTKNLVIKLISLGLAFITWISVVNISNPEVTVKRQIPVEIINEDVILATGKTYEVDSDLTVTVSYTIRTRDEYKISASDLKAYIDLNDLYDITGSVPVQVQVLRNENLLTSEPVATPRVMHVTLDEYVSMKLGVSVVAVGNPADGFHVRGAEVNPNTIIIRGPKNIIGNVSFARVDVDVEGASTNLTGTKGFKFCNSAGAYVDVDDDRVSVDAESVEYVLYLDSGEVPVETEPETVAEPTYEPSPGMNPTFAETEPSINIVDDPNTSSESSASETSPAETSEGEHESEDSDENEPESSTESSAETQEIVINDEGIIEVSPVEQIDE